MKKALYILLLVIEAASLFLPLFFILYLHEFLVSAIAFLAIAAVYAFLGIRAFKQKKAEDEAGLKKSKISSLWFARLSGQHLLFISFMFAQRLV